MLRNQSSSCNISQSGLGAVPLQDNQPVAYASRALTDVESRYTQIEKELLAIAFAFNKFHQYVYGKSVLLESDHKPLESIFKKSLATAPPRLTHMLLQLQKYSFTIAYKPGKELFLANTLSRAYIDENDNADRNLEEDLIYAVNFALGNVPMSNPYERLQQLTLQWAS